MAQTTKAPSSIIKGRGGLILSVSNRFWTARTSPLEASKSRTLEPPISPIPRPSNSISVVSGEEMLDT